MRITKRLSVVLVVLLTSLVVLQPVPAGAKDCSAEKAAYDELVKEVAALEKDLNAALATLGRDQVDMANVLQKMDAVQNILAGEPAKVQAEMNSTLNGDIAKSVAQQLALAIALALLTPELIGHVLHTLFELAETAHTAHDVYTLVNDAKEAQTVLDEMQAALGSLDSVLAFADAHGLSELKYMITQEQNLAALTIDFKRAFAAWADAADTVVATRAILDAKVNKLNDALAALLACLAQPEPVPSPCGGPAPPSDGGIHAGQCR